MRLSTRGRYGTRMMLDLAAHYDQGPTPLREIAQRQDLSAKYLEQLIIPLKAAGFILSLRGAKGGYTLAKKPDKIRKVKLFQIQNKDIYQEAMTSITADLLSRLGTNK